ncbi:hypothetical protein [Jiella avicenniae]|uniref:Uncharacterized protein n=1 Tax=Jiella avicenniae TaxID=2907202 RepID=A0A9X1NZS5_9HYPH|nr:hypothetical protein [Jiella avicenniae]MCE7026718.1 hypothetical protein [Jiella avicenniae]
MTKLDEERARQGRRGTPVLMILIVALALCAVLFVGFQIYNANAPDSALENAEQSGAAPAQSEANTNDATVVSPDAGGTAGGADNAQ